MLLDSFIVLWVIVSLETGKLKMAVKPLTREQIALNEKKMNMTLDDIIKMSKKTTSNSRKPRDLNKNQKFPNSGAAQRNSSNVRRFMDSRASVRQGVLAQRRSNIQTNQFRLTTAIARKAAAAPVCNMPLNRNRMVNWSKPRVGTSPVQRKTTGGSFSEEQRQVKVVSKQWWPRTSNSLFANMKDLRIEVVSQQNNSQWNVRRDGQQRQQRRRVLLGNWAYKSIRSTFGVIV
ncbi:hypothetical protein BVC80_9007g40 [Macleaya cordata]|uniref:Uncharacterized protein n=1 Tax=Macleaya cordata TaxID=56857 RepID=A0A200QLI2_MACCD|nr:hypothetical protein BVC80_9007g40 [Macleaya cordata]